MPYISYIEKRFSEASEDLIEKAEEILEEYAEDGLTVTLRQLYYQFVARGLIENTVRAYKRLGSVISDAREAGRIDWNSIEDRGRELITRAAWGNPQSIMDSAAASYRRDKWATQPTRVEVWVEKQALIGVIDLAAREANVPAFACKGYVSKSAIWRAGRRVLANATAGQRTVIIHLGDHDPSGIDMTRDIEAQVRKFSTPERRQETAEIQELRRGFRVRRIALNFDQVEEFSPPPNPAKLTDSRSKGYVEEFGYSSWELDALDPKTLRRLITEEIALHRDDDRFAAEKFREDLEREQLRKVSRHWDAAMGAAWDADQATADDEEE